MNSSFDETYSDLIAETLQSSDVLSKLERLLEPLLDAVLQHEPLVVTLRQRPRSMRSLLSLGSSTVTLSFPGKSPFEAWRFTVYLRLMELIQDALMNKVTVTKRELYYKDPNLFGRQSVVDQCVDTLAYTLSETRSALNVEAAAKGLIAGHIWFAGENGSWSDGSASNVPKEALIPMLGPNDLIFTGGQTDVLVVEKEAIFHSITQSAQWPQMAKQCILLTGKGYPDLTSRKLVSKLASLPSQRQDRLTAVWGVADYDPDGMSILLNYKYGSISLSHEGAAATTPALRWLGCNSSDIAGRPDNAQSQSLRRLAQRDLKKAVDMLEWPYMDECWEEHSWRRELQVMLLLGYKFEIEMLEHFEDRLLCCLGHKQASNIT